MKVNFEFDEKDFLEYQLYNCSKSELFLKTRKKSRESIGIILISVAFLFLYNSYIFWAIFFSIASVILYIFYPLFDKKHYKKHYEKYILETYIDNFGEIYKLDLDEEFLKVKGKTIETIYHTSEIVAISEISNLIFIILKNKYALILSKDKIAEIEKIKMELKELSLILKINYNLELNWEWK